MLERIKAFRSVAWCCICAGLFGAAPLASSAGKHHGLTALPSRQIVDRIPFQYDPLTLPIPVVQISINGGIPLPFAVDTGFSAPIVIFTRTAKTLGLKSDGVSLHVQPGNRSADRVTLQSLRIVAEGADRFVTFKPPITGIILPLDEVAQSYGRETLAGLLGWPILRYLTVQLDFAARLITLLPQDLPPSSLSDAARLALTYNPGDGLYRVNVELAPKRSVPLIVDTGAFGIVLPQRMVSGLSVSYAGTYHMADLSGQQDTAELLLPQVKFGSLTEPDVAVYAKPEGFAALGMSILARFVVVLDIPHHQMLLTRAANYRETVRLPGPASVVLSESNGTIAVQSVLPGCAPDRAGIKAGDQLLAVDGRPVRGLTAFMAQLLLNGYSGTAARVTVQRAPQSTIDVDYIRDSVPRPSGTYHSP